MEELAEVGGLEVVLANIMRSRVIESITSTPDYPNLYVVTGPSGVGKSTFLKELVGLLPHINYVEAATDRPRRQSEDGRLRDSQSIQGGHEFLTRAEMDARIASIRKNRRKAITWSLEAKGADGVTPVFNRYLVERTSVDSCLGDGKDFIIPTPVPGAVRALRRAYPNAHVVYIRLPLPSVYRLMNKNSRPPLESIERLHFAATHFESYDRYGREFGSVIKNQDPTKDIVPLQHIVSRVAHLIQWARSNYAPNLPAVMMHANYAAAVQTVLSGSDEPLTVGRVITIPPEVIAEYNQLRLQQWDGQGTGAEKPILLPDVVKMRVSEVQDFRGVRSMVLQPVTNEGHQELDLEGRAAFGGAVIFHLARQGILSATFVRGFKDLVRQEYHLTDYAPKGPFWRLSGLANNAIYSVNITVGQSHTQGQSLPR